MKPSQKRNKNSRRRQGVLVSPGVEARSNRFYEISVAGRSITCRVCGWTSYEPHDVDARFCPRCREFHRDRELMDRLAEGYQTIFHPTDKRNLLRVAA